MAYQIFGEYIPKQETLFGDDVFEPIVFRPEQKEAIEGALKHFCTSTGRGDEKVYTPTDSFRQFLWNAKMRFGKTLCALELAKRMGVKRTLIVTHRPVVDEGWHNDFNKIFHDTKYRYATRTDDEQTGDFYSLNRNADKDGRGFIFFVSMQYLRRSILVGGDNAEELKRDILLNDWDLVVVDEAHEGTRTALGKQVIDRWLSKEKTKVLHLSGTPFNLYEDFEDKEIYTWDYTKEQRAKREWAEAHPGEFNPYAELPRMNIYTYDLGKLVKGYVDEGQIFKFSEFFRVWTGNTKADHPYTIPSPDHIGRFVHEDDVNAFLDLLCKRDDTNNYPYSTDEFRRGFRHTLWVVPGVKEAKAMKALLQQHRIFKRFHVINVAGEGDKDETRSNALDQVKKAIGEIPEQTSTITLSCGRLTTGVTVRPWTAVFYMKGSDTTSAATYMQTIFRVQSPWVNKAERRMKANCYVFDFAPERTLNAIAETAKFASLTQKEKRSATTTDKQQDIINMDEFLKYCNVISLEGGQMNEYEADELFGRLQQVYVDRVVRNGFNDNNLYDEKALLELAGDELNEFNALGKLIGETTNMEKPKKASPVELDHLTPEQRAELERKRAEIRKKIREARKNGKNPEDELTPEELAEREREKAERKAKRDERDKRITILRGISLRIPLMIYGAKLDDENTGITIDNFTQLVDPASWEEFMPRGVTKAMFNKFKKCYNPTVFTAAGKRIRKLAREADTMHIDDRIERLNWIFSTFHNPDKETVLTPWRVVNMHMSDTLGGYCFFNERFDGPNQIIVEGHGDKLFDFIDTTEPRFVDRGEVTKKVLGSIDLGNGIASRVLEINSKTGLYPLYVAYTMYRMLLNYYDEYDKAHPNETPLLDNPIDNLSIDEEHAIWDDVIGKNIYVICNTQMAARITRRTLMGFRDQEKKLNIKADKLIDRVKEDRKALVNAIKTAGYWNGTTSKTMIEFDAVVGNPPYQEIKPSETNGANKAFASAIYPVFIDLAIDTKASYVSLITPSRWMTRTGQGIVESWVDKMLDCNHFLRISDFYDASDVFPNIEIKGGVNYFLYQESYEGKCDYSIKANNQVNNYFDYLNFKNAGIVIRDTVAMSILNRIISVEGNYFEGDKNFSGFVGPQHFYDKDGLLTTSWQGYSERKDKEHCIKYYLNKNLISDGFGWIKASDVPKNKDTIKLHKVFISKAYGAGDTFPHQIIGVPFYGEPNSVCSQTYLCLGYDPKKHNWTEEQCKNIISYISTKFFRFLVYIKKKTQDNPSAVFQFVPIQDFNESWSDEKLYKKYRISDSDIKVIDSLIKPME